MATSFRAKTHTLDASPGEPAGAAQGDDLFLWVVCAAAGTPAAPSGWTVLGTWNGTNSKFALWWIKRGASAPSYTWTGGSGFIESSALAYQGRVSSSTPLIVANAARQINPQNPDCPAAATAAAGSMILAFGGSWTGSVTSVWAPPSGYTIREDGVSVGNDIMVAEKLLLAGGADNPAAFSNGSATLDDVAEATVTLPADSTGGFSIPRIQPALPGSPFFLAWTARPQPRFSSAGPQNYTQPLTGGLSFAGAEANSTLKALAGVLSFTGAQAKRVARALSGALSFTGAQSRTIVRALAGVLSFTGAHAKAASRALSGVLSFSGNFARSMAKALSGVLSFTGAQARRTARALAGVLSFTGAFSGIKTGGTLFLQALTATLSFTGAQSKIAGKALAGVLSFAGAQAKRVAHGLTAALSFTGASNLKTARALAGVLSFTGALAGGHLFARALTASLGFTGAHSKRAAKALSAGLSFTGAMNRRIGRAFTGALGFIGALIGALVGQRRIRSAQFSLLARRMVFSALVRTVTFSLGSRKRVNTFVIAERGMTFSLLKRSITFTLG